MNHSAYRRLSMPCPVMRGGLRFMLKGAEESEVVDRGVGLAENERQLRRIDEGRPAEGVEQLSFGEGHVSNSSKV